MPGQALEFIEGNIGSFYDGQIARVFCSLMSVNVNIQFKKSNSVAIQDLKPGMYLLDEIALKNGLLLVPKGVFLNPSLVDKILSLSSLLNMEKEIKVSF